MCFNGCEKNPLSEEPVQNSSQFTIEQAEAWFGSEWTGAMSIKSGNIEKARIGIKPDWCNGFTSQNDEVEVVEVGLMVQGWFGMSDEASYQDWVKTKNSKMIRSLTRMVFLKYKKDEQIDQFLMTVVGDKEYHDKNVGSLADNSYLTKEKHFSGRIYYHDLTGKFVNGWVYEKGELVGITTQSSGDGLPTELKMASTCLTTNVYTTYLYCTDIFFDSNHNGTYDLGVDQYMTYSCHSVFSAPAPFTECPVYSTSLDGFKTDYVVKVGGTNGGYDPSQSTAPQPCTCLNKCSVCGKCKDALILKSGSTSCVPWAVCSCPPVPVIEISTKFGSNEKVMCIYSNLIQTAITGFNPLVTSFLANFSNGVRVNPGDIAFDLSSLSSAYGQCAPSGAKYNITLNENEISGRASIEIAKTLMHEILHAQIGHSSQTTWQSFNTMFEDYIFVKEGERYVNQHQLMMENYVTPMINFLSDYDSLNGYSAPYEYYKAIALNGLQIDISTEELNKLHEAENYFRTRGLNCQ